MKTTDLGELLEGVIDQESFLAFADALRRDREAEGATDVFGRGSNGWENHTIEAFLEAAIGWARDSTFGSSQDLSGASPWKLFATFLYCGKIYE